MNYAVGENRINKIINLVALLILIMALIIGWVIPEDDFLPFAKESLPEAQTFVKVASSPLTYEGKVSDSQGKEQIIGYVVIDEATGYGGPITMVTGINLEGKIIGTTIAKHQDTPSFISIVLKHNYLDQFVDKNITDPLSIEKDIDRVSGATYSTRGIAKAIASGSHAVAKKQFGLAVKDEVIPFKFGLKEISVLLLVALMLIGVIFKFKKIRWVTLIGGLVFIGFQFNTPISLANVAALLMGNFPPIRENLIWYVLLVGIPIITFIVGRNLYCFWLCPFGALQEILAKIGGGSFKCCNKKIEAKLSKIKYVIVYLVLLGAILLKSPGFAGYEPFATLFSMQGFGVQWFILPVVLFSSLFIKRFWCRFFCPGFVINGVILEFRRLLIKLKNKFRYSRVEEGIPIENKVSTKE
ncbi:MAG: FMN-binding protein [Eubacteriales bacterium]